MLETTATTSAITENDGPAAAYANGGPLAGSVTRCALKNEPEQTYYLYVPSRGGEGAPVLVTVHGITRNAEEQAEAFKDIAECHGTVIVAPLFSSKRFPGYQRLGVGHGHTGRRPDAALDAILDEVNETIGARTDRVTMFGFSGGGQFAHRYAMAYPARVNAVAMGAPGWFTFPDRDTAFPRGLRMTSKDPRFQLPPESFLRIPMAVLVGERDYERDSALNMSPRIDRQQGHTRVERGCRWIAAMRQASTDYGYTTKYEYRLLANCGHLFSDCMERGGMGSAVFDFLACTGGA